jgi:S1 RNA binding domain protein
MRVHGLAFLGAAGSFSMPLTTYFVPALSPLVSVSVPSAISRRNHPPQACADSSPHALVGQTLEAVVQRVAPYGVFVVLRNGRTGLVHISELSNHFVNDVNDVLSIGDKVMVKVLAVDERARLSLSVKQAALKGHARTVQLGGDWGHPWGDDGEARWVDMGPRSRISHYPWEADPRLFTFDWSPESLERQRNAAARRRGADDAPRSKDEL